MKTALYIYFSLWLIGAIVNYLCLVRQSAKEQGISAWRLYKLAFTSWYAPLLTLLYYPLIGALAPIVFSLFPPNRKV